MKMKEKLAMEYSETFKIHCCCGGCRCGGYSQVASYKAGFDQAREMLIKKMLAAHITYYDALEAMGEEEV